MYICTSVSNTHARVSVLRIKFKSKETEDFCELNSRARKRKTF